MKSKIVTTFLILTTILACYCFAFDKKAPEFITNTYMQDTPTTDFKYHNVGKMWLTITNFSLIGNFGRWKIDGENFEIVWVGDSRAYLWDGEILAQVTKDHSLVQVLVDEGSITPAEARVHPQRNYVTQAIGMSDLQTLEVGRVQGRLVQGQQFLLCSDGLSGEVSDTEISEILKLDLDEKQKTDLLIQKSLDNGGADNVTVLLVSAVEAGQSEYVRQLFAALIERRSKFGFVSWFAMHDPRPGSCETDALTFFEPGAEPQGEDMQAFVTFICHFGLRRSDGTPKGAWDVWVREAREYYR